MKALQGLPAITVQLPGGELSLGESEALASIRVQERLSLPSQCEIALVAPPASLAQRALVPGGPLRVELEGGALFDGEVVAVEFAMTASRQRELRVRGYDRLHRLRRRQPVRAHAAVTVRDLAATLCGDLALAVEAESEGPRWPWVLQWSQTDLELLADLAARCGLYLALREVALHLLTLEGIGEPVPLSPDEGLLECAVEINGDGSCSEVHAAGWDLAAVELHAASAGSPRGRAPEVPGAGGPRTLGDEPAPTAAHPEQAAQAELDRRAAGRAVLRGVAEGNLGLRAGARVELSGVDPAADGRYTLSSVNHLIDPHRGFLSEISSAPPDPPRRNRSPGATVGVVTRVDGDNGRVKVALTSFGEVESDWMQVAAAGAGKGKGLVMLPDPGDHVLVLLTQGSTAQGVVLGGLYDSAGPGVSGGSVRRYTLRTPGGNVFQLDDEHGRLHVEDGAGSTLEMSRGEVKLTARAPLTIEAPGKRVVIRGSAVDFERG